jgi:hypothetical protein
VPTFLCHIARSDDNEQWLIATKARMPSNNQPNFTVHRRSKQRLWNNIVNAMIMSYIVLQEATTVVTTVDRNKHMRSHKQ